METELSAIFFDRDVKFKKIRIQDLRDQLENSPEHEIPDCARKMMRLIRRMKTQTFCKNIEDFATYYGVPYRNGSSLLTTILVCRLLNDQSSRYFAGNVVWGLMTCPSLYENWDAIVFEQMLKLGIDDKLTNNINVLIEFAQHRRPIYIPLIRKYLVCKNGI